MLELLPAIIAALTTDGHLAGVHMVDHPDVLPRSARLPAAGVCDGGEEPPADLTCSGKERTLYARVAVWTPARDEGGAGLVDVLNLSTAVQQLLHGNLLGLDGMIDAREHGAAAADLMELDGAHCMRRTLTFRYLRQE
jgi:hypothetical protein